MHLEARQLAFLLAQCSDDPTLETGGILIGRYNTEHDTALVTQASAPPPDSCKGRMQFWRGTKNLQRLLDSAWRKGEYYLGEWHYHPRRLAQPSAMDIRQMKCIAKSIQYRSPEPILIIIGGLPPADWDISVAVFPRGLKPILLG